MGVIHRPSGINACVIACYPTCSVSVGDTRTLSYLFSPASRLRRIGEHLQGPQGTSRFVLGNFHLSDWSITSTEDKVMSSRDPVETRANLTQWARPRVAHRINKPTWSSVPVGLERRYSEVVKDRAMWLFLHALGNAPRHLLRTRNTDADGYALLHLSLTVPGPGIPVSQWTSRHLARRRANQMR